MAAARILGLFHALIGAGYFVDVLDSSGFGGFDAKHYSALLLVDPEKKFLKQESGASVRV